MEKCVLWTGLIYNGSIKAAAREIQSKKVDIHGMINITGINKDALFQMTTYQDMIDTFQFNFFSQIIFSQYIGRILPARYCTYFRTIPVILRGGYLEWMGK